MKRAVDRLIAAWHERAFLMKAVSFALVGVVNVTVNYAVFWLVLQTLTSNAPSLSTDMQAVIANVLAWTIAVTGSYIMNSRTTFKRESGGVLSWRAYLTFCASGLLGLIADTGALLIASRFLPIMLAKLVAIGAGFIVNFSMSHFVVFRPQRQRGEPG